MEDDECTEELGRPISSLKVADLRDELASRNLVKTGNKKELVDRLRGAIQRSSQQSSPQKSSQEPQLEAVDNVNETSQNQVASGEIEATNLIEKSADVPAEIDNQSSLGKVELANDNEPVDDKNSHEPTTDDIVEEAGTAVQNEQISQDQKSQVQLDIHKDHTNVTTDDQIDKKGVETNELDKSLTNAESETSAIADAEHDERVDQNDENSNSQTVQQSQPITLKRGPDRSASASSKEKRRKWSSKDVSEVPDASGATESERKGVIAGGISSQIIQKLIEEKPSTTNDLSKTTHNSSTGETSIEVDQKLDDGQAAETLIDISKANDRPSKKEEDHADKPSEKQEVEEEEREPTNVLLVQNLVRPFTLTQLKEVLTKYGPIVEDKFWTDKVKSKCCVVYETIESAIATKDSLHGQQWPPSNPKTLKISYTDEETLIQYQQSDSKKPDSENVENGASEPKLITDRLGEKTGEDGTVESIKKRIGERVNDDLGTKSSNILRDGADSQIELDDLYKKTTAAPHLYWLSLGEEEAEARKKQREEREARFKEFERKRRASPPARRRSPSPRRRSPPPRRRSPPPRRRSPFQSRRRSPPPRNRSPISRRSPPRHRTPIHRHRSPVSSRSPLMRRHSPMIRRGSPPRRRSPIRRSPFSPERPIRSNYRSPIRRSPSPGPIRRSPMLSRRSPGPIRRSPGPIRRSPGPIRRSPGPMRRSPPLMRRPRNRSPLTRRSPPRHRTPQRHRSPVSSRSPPPRRRSPMLRRGSPPRRRSPARRSPLSPERPMRSIYRSPGRRSPSPGPIRRSPMMSRRSPGPIRRSPGPIRRSPGPIRRSPGLIRRSPGLIRRSPGPIRK